MTFEEFKRELREVRHVGIVTARGAWVNTTKRHATDAARIGVGIVVEFEKLPSGKWCWIGTEKGFQVQPEVAR